MFLVVGIYGVDLSVASSIFRNYCRDRESSIEVSPGNGDILSSRSGCKYKVKFPSKRMKRGT